jgi:hypothetical protein
MDGDVARTACASVCFAAILHIITLPDAPAVVRIPIAPFMRALSGTSYRYGIIAEWAVVREESDGSLAKTNSIIWNTV